MQCEKINNMSNPKNGKAKKKQALKEAEDDLLFYLEFYKHFPDSFRKRIADKEIEELEKRIKNNY